MSPPGYFAAAEIAAREQKVGIIIIEVARPDFRGGRPQQIRRHGSQGRRQGPLCDPRLRARQAQARLCDRQGSSSTVNLVKALPKLEEAGINVKVISAISEELFDHQPEAYRNSVLPPEALLDAMVVTSGTRRVWPVRGLGPLTDAYSLTSDWDNQWLTGGLEKDVIAEAHLDPDSIFKGIERFAKERTKRLTTQSKALTADLAAE